jgi:peptide/nickel transport system substrate-binding protein
MSAAHQRNRRLRSIGLAAGVAALALAGCGGGGGAGGQSNAATNGSPATSTTTAPANGDVAKITWGLPFGEPNTIDPIFGLDYSPSLVSSQLCDSLLRGGPDGSLKPGLASFRQPDDKTLVYTLRQGPKFWDGKPVTPADVVYSLKRAAAPDSYIVSFFANVKSIKATGPHQVTVALSKPDALLNKEMVSFAGAIVEKDFSEKAGKKLGSPSKGIMCSGPFKLASWKPGSSIELVRNDQYWDPAYRAHAKRLSFRFFDDSTALTQALLSGEIDGAYEVPSSAIPALRKAKSGRLLVGPSRQYVTLERRRTTGPIADDKLRQALYSTIDRPGIAKVVFEGAASAAYTLVTPSSWDPAAKAQYAAAYAPYVKAGQMDAAAGKKLVEQSGYKGEPVELAVLAGDATQNQLSQIIQQSAAAIGVTVKIRSLTSNQYSEALVDGKADAGDLIMTVSFNVVPDPLEQIGFYVLPSSPYNYTHYDDPKVTSGLAQAQSTLDPAARAKLLIDVQRRYESAYEFTSLVQKDEVSFLNNRLTGAPTSIDYLFGPSLAAVGAAR